MIAGEEFPAHIFYECYKHFFFAIKDILMSLNAGGIESYRAILLRNIFSLGPVSY